MAERRMMSKKIIHSDAFLDMPTSSQNLYFHLLLEADDEGFVNSPKKVQRIIGASDDDAKILSAKKFIIGFDSGVIVIKHWRIHNYIQNDRFKFTTHTKEKAQISVKDNNVYTMDTECIQDVYKMYPICTPSIGESSIDEIRIEENKYIGHFDLFWKAYPKKQNKGQAEKAWAKLSKSKDKPKIEEILNAIELYKKSKQVKEGFVKNPSTWISGKCWLDEYEIEVKSGLRESIDRAFGNYTEVIDVQ